MTKPEDVLNAIDFCYNSAVQNQYLYDDDYIEFVYKWLTALLLASEIDSYYQSHIEECYWAALTIFN